MQPIPHFLLAIYGRTGYEPANGNGCGCYTNTTFWYRTTVNSIHARTFMRGTVPYQPNRQRAPPSLHLNMAALRRSVFGAAVSPPLKERGINLHAERVCTDLGSAYHLLQTLNPGPVCFTWNYCVICLINRMKFKASVRRAETAAEKSTLQRSNS